MSRGEFFFELVIFFFIPVMDPTCIYYKLSIIIFNSNFNFKFG
jgi:hypothetical protein